MIVKKKRLFGSDHFKMVTLKWITQNNNLTGSEMIILLA